MAAIPTHPTDFRCKRNMLYDDSIPLQYGFDEEFSEKLKLVPCCSENQAQSLPSIYRGPGAGKGYTYYFLQLSEQVFRDVYFEHTIFFKGDSFTVREDIYLNISEEEKQLRPPEDKMIRSVLDPANKEFLECLENELCPTEFFKARDGSEFSKERDGLHIIQLVGLHDDQDLEAPAIPHHCQMMIHNPEMQV